MDKDSKSIIPKLPPEAYLPKRSPAYKKWKSTLIPLPKDDFLILLEVLTLGNGITKNEGKILPRSLSFKSIPAFYSLVLIPRGTSSCGGYDRKVNKERKRCGNLQCSVPILAIDAEFNVDMYGLWISIFTDSFSFSLGNKCADFNITFGKVDLYFLPNL